MLAFIAILVLIPFGLASESLQPDDKWSSGSSGMEENVRLQIHILENDQIDEEREDGISAMEPDALNSGEELILSGGDEQSSGDQSFNSGEELLFSIGDEQSSGDQSFNSGEELIFSGGEKLIFSGGYEQSSGDQTLPVFFYEEIVTITILIECKENEVYDKFRGCLKNFNLPDHYPVDDKNVTNCEDYEAFDSEQMICYNISTECQNGSLIALEEGEFEYVGNNQVYFDGVLFKVQLNSSEGLPVICVNYSQNGSIHITTTVFMYPIGFEYLTYIGCFLSLVAYSLVLVTFCAFKELRTLPTKILICISIASIGFNVLTLSVVMGAGENVELCQAVAIGLHFFILAQFTWMTVMCIEMVYTFYLASRLRPVQIDASQKRFCVYFVVSWTLPVLFVSGVIAVNFTSSELIQYGWNEETENQNCWINHFNSAIVVFIAPMLALALLQLLLYITVGILICSSHAKKSNTTSKSGKSTPYFRILLGLFFASNIMWVFGFMAIWIGIEWAWYPFHILLSSQGTVIFLGFFGTTKVLKLYVSTFAKIKTRYATFRNTKSTTV